MFFKSATKLIPQIMHGTSDQALALVAQNKAMLEQQLAGLSDFAPKVPGLVEQNEQLVASLEKLAQMAKSQIR